MKKTPKKILLIEDEKPLLNALRDRFEAERFVVSTALNGKEGLMKTEQEKPDIILLDLVMPKMDGLTMLRELGLRGKKIPVIILTNLDDEDHMGKAMSLGAFEYLIKSNWKLSDIVQRVKLSLKAAG